MLLAVMNFWMNLIPLDVQWSHIAGVHLVLLLVCEPNLHPVSVLTFNKLQTSVRQSCWLMKEPNFHWSPPFMCFKKFSNFNLTDKHVQSRTWM